MRIDSSSNACVHWSKHTGPIVDFIIFKFFEWVAMERMVTVLAHSSAALAHISAAFGVEIEIRPIIMNDFQIAEELMRIVCFYERG